MTLQQKELFQKSPLLLENGETLSPVLVGYETYGTLSASRDNCILLEHALTGTAHAAKHFESDAPIGGMIILVRGKRLIQTNIFWFAPMYLVVVVARLDLLRLIQKLASLSAYSFRFFD